MGISHFRSSFCRRMNLLMERDTSFSTTTSRMWMFASVVAAVATSIAVAAAIGLPATANADDSPTEQSETATVDPEQASETAEFAAASASEPISCIIKSIDVTLRARVNGMIESTFVEGQGVKKNEVVARLDTTQAEIQKNIAEQRYRASSAQAENDVNVRYAMAQEHVVETEVTEVKQANERAPGSISESEVRRRMFQLTRAKLAVEQANRDLKFSQASLGVSEAEFMAAKQLLEAYTVRSPIDGVVEEVYARHGELVNRGDPICNIQRMDQLRITAYVPFEKYQPEQLLNRQVVIQGRRGDNEFLVQGKISRVGSKVDQAGHLRVTVYVGNQRIDGSWLLLPGMTASLHLSATKASKANAGLGLDEETKTIVIDTFTETVVGNALRAQTEVDEEELLMELVASLSMMQQRIKALSDARSRGGETQQLAEVECELAIAKARLASAKGDEDESRKQYETATKSAERLVQTQEAAYDTGTITLDRLLRGYRTRAETKAWLKRASAK
jgi:multidrug efflux pump subunit AcrA (membrane-fusion protein)